MQITCRYKSTYRHDLWSKENMIRLLSSTFKSHVLWVYVNIYLSYLSSLRYRFKLVASVLLSVSAHYTQEFLVCFAEELQLLVVIGAHQHVTQGLWCLCG